MYPELLQLGPFVISSYGFMLVMAFLAAYVFIQRDGKRLGWQPELAQDIIFWSAVGGVLGAKIYYLIENIGRGSGRNIAGLGEMIAGLFTLNLGRIAEGIQNFGAGLVFFGGLMGGILAVTLLVRRRKMKWLPMADVLAPYMILGYAVGRVGCFLVGDDYGVPSNLPWAMAFPNGLPPTAVAVHPTQLYEIILGLAIFGFLFQLRPKARFAGQVFALYLLLVGTERFFIEFLRRRQWCGECVLHERLKCFPQHLKHKSWPPLSGCKMEKSSRIRKGRFSMLIAVS